jgi:hypothetical protein
MQTESHDIETATTATSSFAPPHANDATTRLIVRLARRRTQRRVGTIVSYGAWPGRPRICVCSVSRSLWAATGQSALESARILVIGASATSTSILKNLVLPGIGHFTILDHATVSPADAGNNFFLEGPASIGKNRAEEAVRLLRELNDSVDGVADTRDIRSVLADAQGRSWIAGFTLVIAHNLPNDLLTSLAGMLWKDRDAPALMAVRSAGFLAEFSIQFHEHQSA